MTANEQDHKGELLPNEVPYTIEEAMAEASRCLHCAQPLCRTGCPIENDIPNFIQAIAKGNFGIANDIIRERSNLPAICGRVCAKEKQCEGACILNRAKKPIHIGKLESFAADFVSHMKAKKHIPIIKDKGKIAVIGSGPAGLTVTGDMLKAGYEVTVYESLPDPGGILLFGIPDFRLSKDIVQRQVDVLKDMGAQFKCNINVGKDITISQLFEEGYDAVFVGTGTSVPMKLHIPGVDKVGVLQATRFLTIVQLVHNGESVPSEIPIKKGDDVIVIGAGNVAIDAARTALRQEAASVTIAYRRGKENMPCNPSEFEEAVEEGIQFKFYSAPVEIIGDEVSEGLRCEKQEVKEDGTMIPMGEYFTLKGNKIIIAIGHQPNDMLVGEGNEVGVNEGGYVITKKEPYGMTTRMGVFAAGDVVHKPATVVLGMREAKKVALGMVQYCEAKRLLSHV